MRSSMPALLAVVMRPALRRSTPCSDNSRPDRWRQPQMPWPTVRDDALFSMIDREVERQNTTLQLIASENFASPAVMSATGSVLTNKYSEGYPGKRYYGGNQIIDEVEELARTRAATLFGAEHAN